MGAPTPITALEDPTVTWKKISPLFWGALTTAIIFSAYIATYYQITIDGESSLSEAEWIFDIAIFFKALPFVLLISIAAFLLAGTLWLGLLRKNRRIPGWVVVAVSLALGAVNPLLHPLQPELPHGWWLYLLGLIAIPAGTLVAYCIWSDCFKGHHNALE